MINDVYLLFADVERMTLLFVPGEHHVATSFTVEVRSWVSVFEDAFSPILAPGDLHIQ